jgi:hypothetical protein
MYQRSRQMIFDQSDLNPKKKSLGILRKATKEEV